MSKEFQVTTEDNLKQYEITFNNESDDNKSHMTFNFEKSQDFDFFKRRLIAYRNGYPRINFTMNYDEEINAITIEGNMANALKILKDQKLLSSTSYNKIYADIEVKQLLDKSAQYKVKKEKIPKQTLFASYQKYEQQSSEVSVKNNEEVSQAKNQLKTLYLNLPADTLKDELTDFVNQVLKEKGLEGAEIKFNNNIATNSPKL